jgi:hypothetical protein
MELSPNAFFSLEEFAESEGFSKGRRIGLAPLFFFLFYLE